MMFRGGVRANTEIHTNDLRLSPRRSPRVNVGCTDMKILALEKEVAGVTEEQFTDEILRAEAGKA